MLCSCFTTSRGMNFDSLATESHLKTDRDTQRERQGGGEGGRREEGGREGEPESDKRTDRERQTHRQRDRETDGEPAERAHILAYTPSSSSCAASRDSLAGTASEQSLVLRWRLFFRWRLPIPFLLALIVTRCRRSSVVIPATTEALSGGTSSFRASSHLVNTAFPLDLSLPSAVELSTAFSMNSPVKQE